MLVWIPLRLFPPDSTSKVDGKPALSCFLFLFVSNFSSFFSPLEAYLFPSYVLCFSMPSSETLVSVDFLKYSFLFS